MSDGILGRRVLPTSEGEVPQLEPADYCIDGKDKLAMTPTGLLCNLGGHKITENADGTITVSPSILVNGPGKYHNPAEGTWHGHLEGGIWRTC